MSGYGGASITQTGLSAGTAAKVYSKALMETDSERKAAAKQAKWDADDNGMVDDEEAFIAENAMYERQKAMLDIILVIRDKIRQNSGSSYATRELKKVFAKFDPDGSGEISWYEFDKALIELGVYVTEQEMSHLMELFDSDGGGSIEWQEFCQWCDDRIPLNLEKMRKIIAAHEGHTKAKGPAGPVVSSGYMKKWLEVHKAEVDTDISTITNAKATGLVKNVKLLGDGKKVEAALQARKEKRLTVISNLRAAVVAKAGNVPLKEQLDSLWRTFDVNGDGLINWKEFTQGMSNMGIELSAKELSDIMKEFDTNCDGALDYVEFVGQFLPKESGDLAQDFERCTMARRAMLQSRGIDRNGMSRGKMK